MKKITIPFLLAALLPVGHLLAERPLLLSDINPSQLYTKQQMQAEISALAHKSDSNLSPLQQEYSTLEKIKSFKTKNLSDEELKFLTDMANYQSKVFVKHDEGPLPIAIFDIASAAKHQLNQFYVGQHLEKFIKLRASDWQSYRQALLRNDDLSSALIGQAKVASFDALSSDQSADIARALTATRNYADPLLVKAISNSNDKQLLAELLRHNDSPTAHKILVNKLTRFNHLQQAEILKSVAQNNRKLASSAILKYGKLPANVRSDDWLVSQLSDSYLGGSAAKAIGLAQSQSALQAARELAISKSSSRTQVANALLALKFADNAYAKSELTRLVEQNKIKFSDMQLEVEKWLD